MKILAVTPPFHQKSTGAAEHDIIAGIEMLSRMGHEVGVAVLSPGYYDSARAKELVPNGVAVFPFTPPAVHFWKWFFVSVRQPALFDRAAYSFWQMTEDREFQKFFTTEKPDLIISWCSYSWPALFFGRKRKIATLFRSHNYEPSFFFEALTGLERYSPIHWIRRVAKWRGEHSAVHFADSVATIPFEQASLYRKWRNPLDIEILTLIFLGSRLQPPFVHRDKKPLDVFYLGANYNVAFHLRGVESIITAIAPQVLKQAPGAFRFHICGSKLPERLVRQCDGTNIIYEGYVDDFNVFMSRMDIGAFPVRTGKSMKGKVFETISRAFPVVIAPNCLGGYDLKNGSEALIAESNADFVDAILSLEDDALRKKLSEGAANFAEREFATPHIKDVLQKSIARAMYNSSH